MIIDNHVLAMADITVGISDSYENYYFVSYCDIRPLKLRILVDCIAENFRVLPGTIHNIIYTN